MNQELWFPQPIWFEDHDVDFTDAVAFCKKMQSKSDGRVISNRNGWQSGYIDVFEHEELKSVADIILAKVTFLVSQFDSSKYKGARIDGSWININGKNSYNVRHSHARTTFAGCIYLTVPEGSGDIVFYRPDPSNYFPVPEDIYNTVLHRTITYKPRDGLVLIFPAWMEHEVGISNVEEDRISIAFNIMCEEVA